MSRSTPNRRMSLLQSRARSAVAAPRSCRMRRVRAGVLVALGFLSFPAGAHADSSGQPRFVSLRHDTVHVRAGPGQDYPIRWTFKRQGLPVQVLRDYEHWRLIRDSVGDEGWVHQGGLSARRTALV